MKEVSISIEKLANTIYKELDKCCWVHIDDFNWLFARDKELLTLNFFRRNSSGEFVLQDASFVAQVSWKPYYIQEIIYKLIESDYIDNGYPIKEWFTEYMDMSVEGINYEEGASP